LLRMGVFEESPEVQLNVNKNSKGFKQLFERVWNWLKDIA